MKKTNFRTKKKQASEATASELEKEIKEYQPGGLKDEVDKILEELYIDDNSERLPD